MIRFGVRFGVEPYESYLLRDSQINKISHDQGKRFEFRRGMSSVSP
jgi:hypothetical protein